MRWLGLVFLVGFCLLIGGYIYLVEYRACPPTEDGPDVVADDAIVRPR